MVYHFYYRAFALNKRGLPKGWLAMKKVYCLYRVSSKNMVEKNDIPMQRIECEKFAKEKGWYIAKEFVENGVSGFMTSGAKRDAIISLKSAAVKKEFDVLLVFMFDRLGRKKDETPFIVEWFFNQGIEVWSVREGEQRFDYHVDSLINYIRFWQAEGESLKIGERISTRMRQLAEAGQYIGGHVPFGYKKAYCGRLNKKGYPISDIAIDENNIECVREIFNKTVNEGFGSFVLARWCNDNELTTVKGSKFQSNTILRILRNKLYCGYLIRGSTSVFIPHLKIVDEAVFEQAQYILKQRTESDKSKRQIAFNTQGKSLLSGNIFCGYCGSHMICSSYVDRYVRKDGSVYENRSIRYICYHRSRKLNDCKGQSAYASHKIEPIVSNAVNAILMLFKTLKSKDTLSEYTNLRIKSVTKECEQIKFRLSKLKKEHVTLVRYIASSLNGFGAFKTDTLRQAIIDNEGLSEKLSKELESLTADIQDTHHINMMSEYYYYQMADWAKNYNSLPLQNKKMVICQLFNKIEIFYGYEIVIYVDRKYKLMFEKQFSKMKIGNCQIK